MNVDRESIGRRAQFTSFPLSSESGFSGGSEETSTTYVRLGELLSVLLFEKPIPRMEFIPQHWQLLLWALGTALE